MYNRRRFAQIKIKYLKILNIAFKIATVGKKCIVQLTIILKSMVYEIELCTW